MRLLHTTLWLRRSYLKRKVDSLPEKAHYDLAVIGGGSGGLALSKEATKYGKKVALFDYVQPSPLGSTWGLGGTCVNVGCIPKKLMHQAAILGEKLHDAQAFGWQLEASEAKKHDWLKMVPAVQEYIRSLNYGYKARLKSDKVAYYNAYARFTDPKTVVASDSAGKQYTVTADHFAIAVGGRPKYPDIPGAQLCVTSDDLFSLKKPPGKTLVIGASYVALECAGFLTGLGYDVTVMARSVVLRGFDQDIAQKVAQYMDTHGTKFAHGCAPLAVHKSEDASSRLRVQFKTSEGEMKEEEFDTVMLAIGRTALTQSLGLENAGVNVDASSGKIPCGAQVLPLAQTQDRETAVLSTVGGHEATSQPHIFALGDVMLNRPELTPVAIMAGKLLAQRLYSPDASPQRYRSLQMDYEGIPTSVFTPLEYSCVGLSEEAAIKKFGEDNVEVYHSHFKPLEWTLPGGDPNACYAKVIVDKASKPDSERIVGMHYLGPNAGEVMQGYALGFKRGATKSDLDRLVGIHPTTAEEFTTLHITKRSGEDPTKTGC